MPAGEKSLPEAADSYFYFYSVLSDSLRHDDMTGSIITLSHGLFRIDDFNRLASKYYMTCCYKKMMTRVTAHTPDFPRSAYVGLIFWLLIFYGNMPIIWSPTSQLPSALFRIHVL